MEGCVCFNQVDVAVQSRRPHKLGGDIISCGYAGMFSPPRDFTGELNIVDYGEFRIGDCVPAVFRIQINDAGDMVLTFVA